MAKVDLNKLNNMYLPFSIVLKSNDDKFNNKNLTSKMYKPDIGTLATALKESNFKNMFLKSVKKQDIEIVTKYRNLIDLINKRLQLVTKKVKDIENSDMNQQNVDQRKIETLRRILEEPAKSIDEMELKITSTTAENRKNIEILKQANIITKYSEKTRKENNIKKLKQLPFYVNMIQLINQAMNITTPRDSLVVHDLTDEIKNAIEEKLYGQGSEFAVFRAPSSKDSTDSNVKPNQTTVDNIIKNIFELYKLIDGYNETDSSTNTNIKFKTNEIKSIINKANHKLMPTNIILEHKLKSVNETIDNIKKEGNVKEKDNIISFKDIQTVLETNDLNNNSSIENKKKLVSILTILYPLLVRLFKNDESEIKRIKGELSEELSGNDNSNRSSNMNQINGIVNDIENYIRSELGSSGGIYSLANLKVFKEMIEKHVIKTPLVQNNEFRYDNIERLDLCAKELSESLSGTVISVPLFLKMDAATLDKIVGKTLTLDERVALITSNMASLNMIVKERQAFRNAEQQINRIINLSGPEQEIAIKKLVSKYALENIEFVAKTLLNNKTILIQGDAYKVNKVSVPNIIEIQKQLQEILSEFKFDNDIVEAKCIETVENKIPKITVNVTVFESKLTTSQIRSRNCATRKKNMVAYVKYLVRDPEYNDLDRSGSQNIIEQLQNIANK